MVGSWECEVRFRGYESSVGGLGARKTVSFHLRKCQSASWGSCLTWYIKSHYVVPYLTQRWLVAIGVEDSNPILSTSCSSILILLYFK